MHRALARSWTSPQHAIYPLELQYTRQYILRDQPLDRGDEFGDHFVLPAAAQGVVPDRNPAQQPADPDRCHGGIGDPHIALLDAAGQDRRDLQIELLALLENPARIGRIEGLELPLID